MNSPSLHTVLCNGQMVIRPFNFTAIELSLYNFPLSPNVRKDISILLPLLSFLPNTVTKSIQRKKKGAGNFEKEARRTITCLSHHLRKQNSQ